MEYKTIKFGITNQLEKNIPIIFFFLHQTNYEWLVLSYPNSSSSSSAQTKVRGEQYRIRVEKWPTVTIFRFKEKSSSPYIFMVIYYANSTNTTVSPYFDTNQKHHRRRMLKTRNIFTSWSVYCERSWLTVGKKNIENILLVINYYKRILYIYCNINKCFYFPFFF